MRIVSTRDKQNYHILHVKAEPLAEPQSERVVTLVEKILSQGARGIGLFFCAGAYPYSRIISTIVASHKLAKSKGAALAVTQPNHEFREVMRNTNLGEVVRFFDTETEAEGYLEDMTRP